MRPHSTESDPTDEFEVSDDSDTREIQRRPSSFGHRHGLKVLGGILAAMFVTVVVAQVAC